MTVKFGSKVSLPTVVIQSYRTQNIPSWVEACLESVRAWSNLAGFEYEFVGDEIFDLLPDNYRNIAEGRMSVLTDLGRLLLIRRALAGQCSRAVWIDADVLVFDSDCLKIPIDVGHAFSREIWVQADLKKPESLRVYRNVHNAVCLFERGDVFLDFYIRTCKRIVNASQGRVPDQIVGTKLLTALHNIVDFPLIESVGMFSPMVIRDIAQGGGVAAGLLAGQTAVPLGAANLCLSLVGDVFDGVELTNALMEAACIRLKTAGFGRSLRAE